MPGVVVGVYTADCVPILLADDDGRVAAAHAGWRGTVAGVANAAVEALVSIGARRERLRAALGPSICAHCFEVGEEVAARVRRARAVAVCAPTGRSRTSICGRPTASCSSPPASPESAIDAAPPCTMCEAERFFSFRRDGAGIGQHLSFVAAGAREAG